MAGGIQVVTGYVCSNCQRRDLGMKWGPWKQDPPYWVKREVDGKTVWVCSVYCAGQADADRR